MKTKEAYQSPEIQFVLSDEMDIITASGGGIGEDPGPNDGEWM